MLLCCAWPFLETGNRTWFMPFYVYPRAHSDFGAHALPCGLLSMGSVCTTRCSSYDSGTTGVTPAWTRASLHTPRPQPYLLPQRLGNTRKFHRNSTDGTTDQPTTGHREGQSPRGRALPGPRPLALPVGRRGGARTSQNAHAHALPCELSPGKDSSYDRAVGIPVLDTPSPKLMMTSRSAA